VAQRDRQHRQHEIPVRIAVDGHHGAGRPATRGGGISAASPEGHGGKAHAHAARGRGAGVCARARWGQVGAACASVGARARWWTTGMTCSCCAMTWTTFCLTISATCCCIIACWWRADAADIVNMRVLVAICTMLLRPVSGPPVGISRGLGSARRPSRRGNDIHVNQIFHNNIQV